MGLKIFLWSELEKKQWPGQIKYKSLFFACELSAKRFVTFGVVLYRNVWPINFILHFAELQIGSPI